MNDTEFENDYSINIKAHNITIKRSKKEIKLILIYHLTYQVIEIKIYDIPSNKLLGREILDYSDIFQIFNIYFITFNENLLSIFNFINNCIVLKKYEVYINEIAKTINLELFLLKDNNINAKNISITSFNDEEKSKLICQKIKNLNKLFNNENNNTITVAPFLNCIKYETNIHCLLMDVYIEKEIEILVFKATLINKNNNIFINKKEEIFTGFYSRDDINNMTKYYESISNIYEISDDIKINLANKNLKIESISDGKIKISLTVLSSINPLMIIFDLVKGKEIKDKYIQIIKELKLKNEFLANNDIFLNSNYLSPPQRNKSKSNKINNNKNPVQNINKKNLMNENTNEDKKLIGNKRKRLQPIKNPPKRNENNGKFKDGKNDDDILGLSKEVINQNVNIVIENNMNNMLLNKNNLNVEKSQKKESNKIKSFSQKNTEKIKNSKKKK